MARPRTPLKHWGKISFTKTPKGWVARGTFRDHTGRKHDLSVTEKTKVLAETTLRQKSELYQTSQQKISTVGDLFNMWVHEKVHQEELSPTTIGDYQQVWRLHVQERFANLTLFEVTSFAVHEHLGKLSPSNSRRARVVLKGMFDLAERTDLIARNPIKATKSVKRRTKEIKSLSLEQIDEVRTIFMTHDEMKRGPKGGMKLCDFFDTMLGTGIRPGECLALQWANINFTYGEKGDKTTISITGTLRHRDGKGVGPLIKTGFPKTDSSRRTIIVPQFVAEILKQIYREKQPQPSNPVFTTSTGNWVQPNNVNRAIRKLRANVDLGWMTSHSFRKTSATWVTSRLGEEQAARLLGHVNPSITRQHYIDRALLVGDTSDVLSRLGPHTPH